MLDTVFDRFEPAQKRQARRCRPWPVDRRKLRQPASRHRIDRQQPGKGRHGRDLPHPFGDLPHRRGRMTQVIELTLKDEEATIDPLGEDLALALKAGDCLALSGDLGAGKSTLARAFLRAMADDPELEVPSPPSRWCKATICAFRFRISISTASADVSELDRARLRRGLVRRYLPGGVA
jgi:ABC-type glutathione transport system ATPase component